MYYLDLNCESTPSALGQPTRECLAPDGNTTTWTLRWLEHNQYLVFYLTGDIGMGPTRTWLNDDRLSLPLWFFPVLTMGEIVTAEEVKLQGIPIEFYTDWLLAVGQLVERHQTVWLVYFHPPGAEMALPAVTTFVYQVVACCKVGRCRWFTVTQMTEYLNRCHAMVLATVPKGRRVAGKRWQGFVRKWCDGGLLSATANRKFWLGGSRWAALAAIGACVPLAAKRCGCVCSICAQNILNPRNERISKKEYGYEKSFPCYLGYGYPA